MQHTFYFYVFNCQEAVSAAARVAKLPAVRSACAALSILYKDVKGSSPGVRVLCEALESRVGALSTEACSRASPLMDKLENQSEYFYFERVLPVGMDTLPNHKISLQCQFWVINKFFSLKTLVFLVLNP